MLFVLALCLSVVTPPAQSEEGPPSTEQINYAIRSATDYLIRITLPNGEFIYSPNASQDHKTPHHYNVVRHAGTMWGFVMDLDRQQQQGSDTLAALERAARFLFECCSATIPDHDDLLAIWSHPSFERTSSPLKASLGAAGLALVSMAGLEKHKPGSVSLDGLRSLGKFIIYMQKKDGSYFEHYLFSTRQPTEATHNLYYPGEAVLGLLALYELDPSPVWLESAIKAMIFLSGENNLQKDSRSDHWTIMATAVLLNNHGDKISTAEREQLIKASIKIARSLLPLEIDHWSNPDLHGSFDEKGRTTGTASRIEGLTALLDFLPADEQKLRREIITACENGIVFLLRSQIRIGPFAGAIPYAVRPLEGDGTEQTRAFNRSAGMIRIDFVQHVLGALHSYLRVMQVADR